MIHEIFLERMKNMLGDEFALYEATLSEPCKKGLRINRVKADEDFVPPFENLRPVPWAKDGYEIPKEAKAGAHLLHTVGAYYMQEPSAMSAVEILNPKQNEKILDMCAAPGGKTTQAASYMKDTGLIVANEFVPSRARVLKENVVRMGLTHTVVASEHPERLASAFPSYFDGVLVDAPCSGEGMFKKSDDAARDWSPENVSACALRQAAILDSAAKCVRGGGRLVYSTCTFSMEENEKTVASFLARHPEFRLTDFERRGMSDGFITDGADTDKTARIFPHRARGEGHFVALMIKTEQDRVERNGGVRPYRPKASASALRLFRAFCQENRIDASRFSGVDEWGDRLYAVPESPELSGLKVLSAGLELGRIKKDRFEPSQAFASALKESECRYLPLDAEQAARYERGEVLEVGDRKGWYVASYSGFGFGWVKCGGGMGKNHYEKSLRKS